MDDGNYDPCEYVYNHESSMRRLISLLRSNQDLCVDCDLDTLGGLSSQPGQQDPNFLVLFLMGWIVLAIALYLFRPASLRSSHKPCPQGPDHEDPPPSTTC